jgi:hypothetical protein
MTPVHLDHYVGRKVTDINKRSGKWQVVLEGDTRIICYDENYEMPEKDVLLDKVFQKVTLSADVTQLYFGDEDNPASTTMTLPPLQYAISDPDRTDGEPVRPQEGGYVHDPEEDRPEEPAERIAEGPEEDAESDSEGT